VDVLWGVVLIVVSGLAWGGQTLAWFAPDLAASWGLTEAEDDVEPVYHADVRGEARFDALTLWTLLIAGILLVVDNGAWPYFGLVGGGIYAYFAGRGLSARLEMQRRSFRIGSPSNVRVAYLFLVLWGLVGLVTIVVATNALRSA
jgi:hypothetical protein